MSQLVTVWPMLLLLLGATNVCRNTPHSTERP